MGQIGAVSAKSGTQERAQHSRSRAGVCAFLARVLIDPRAPMRSGLRLIDWAAACGAQGVVIPGDPWITGDCAAELAQSAGRRGLQAFLEIAPDSPLAGRATDFQGIVIRARLWEGRPWPAVRNILAIADSPEPDRTVQHNGSHVTWVLDNTRRDMSLWTRARAGSPHANWGYTDSREDGLGLLHAVADGACVVLKTLTLNRAFSGLRYAGSLYPHEFAAAVQVVRPESDGGSAGPAFDSAELRATPSLAASRRLAAGDKLRAADLKVVPALSGISAGLSEAVLGRRLLFNREPGEPLTFGMIEPLSARSSGETLDVSVVIRTKNEAAWIARCLSAVRNQQRPPKEIIVVDNDSTDATVDLARPFDVTALSISESEFSFGRALNRGIAAASGKWIVCLSAHCLPVHDRWLEAWFARGPEPFEPAAAYGRQEPLPDSSDFDKRDLWTTFGEETRVQMGLDYFFHNANSILRKDVWQATAFDESLTGVEDRDWAKRILAEGERIVYLPLASVHHHHGIHQGRNEARAKRVVKVIEWIQQAPAAHPKPSRRSR